MSSPGIEIREEGAAQAARHLAETGARAADVMPVAPAVRAVFAAGERTRFAVQGPGWPQLAETTQQMKAAAGHDPRILRATGRLYDSLANPLDRDAVKGATPGSIELGTEVPYARFHEYGTANMPARRVVELAPQQREQMGALLERWIAHGTERP